MISDFFNLRVFPIKSNRYWLYLYSLIVGAAVSIVIIAYRLLLTKIEHFRESFFLPIRNASFPPQTWGILIFLVLFITLYIGFFMKKYPLIAGGGVPLVKGVFSRQFEFSWSKGVFYKFTTGLLALLAGASLGIEGPSIQLGAETAEGVAKRLKRNVYEKQYFIACGASAGLSAAFHAPISGTVFVLEELVKHISPLLIACTLIASTVASWLSNDIFGLKPFFNFRTDEHFELRLYYLIIIFAIFISILGNIFYKSLLFFSYKIKKMNLNIYVRVFICILLSILASIFFFDITGGGHHLSEKLMQGDFSFKYLFLLLICKGLLTIILASSGIPGGIFIPMMTLGVLAGKIFGKIVPMIYGDGTDYTIYFIIIGLSSFLTCVLKTPLTALVLTMEITGSFNHFFPVAVATAVTLVCSDLLRMKPLYDEVLKRMLKVKNPDFSHEKVVIDIPVGIMSYFENKKISEIKWPKNIVITEIIRGEEFIIPNGDTVLLFGDHIVIFTSARTAARHQHELEEWGEGHY